MEIRRYHRCDDEDKLIALLLGEGDDWSCYTAGSAAEKFKAALEASITYVAYEGETLCGYSRSFNDCGLYIYVCDLLVAPKHRGKEIGRKLMECIYGEFPNCTVYVMSDVDGYYTKLGYHREGSVFEVSKSGGCLGIDGCVFP